MKSLSWTLPVALGFVAVGCGGTTTNDGMSSMNRSGGMMDPGGMPLANSGQEIVGTYAMVAAPSLTDAKQAVAWVDRLKKLTTPPKKLFIFGLNSATALKLKKPLDEAKMSVIPVPDARLGDDWWKSVVAVGAEKFFGNGPTLKEPNVDLITADQSKWNSTFTLDGVKFVLLNTDTPVKSEKGGEIPKLWLQGKLDSGKSNASKEQNTVVLGARKLWATETLGRDGASGEAAAGVKVIDGVKVTDGKVGEVTAGSKAGEGERLVMTADPFGKSQSVRLYATSSEVPSLERPDEKSVYQMVVPSGFAEDKPLIVGLLELRKSGSMTSRMVQIESNFTSKSLIEALVYDPMMRDAAKSLPKQAVVPAGKANEVKKPNAPK